MNRKYVLTNETKIVNGYVLHRIKAVRSFDYVKKGDLGGFVESEDNLSHDDNGWVYDEACVYGNAKVFGNAHVFDESQVYENAIVYGNTGISNYAEVYGHAKVFEDARVHNRSKVCGDAVLYKDVCINYGTVMTDIIATKDWELMLKCLYEDLEINDNKIILYKNVYKTRNKNMSILKSSNGDLIFERNKNIMKFDYFLIDRTLQIKNKSKSDYFAKIQVNLEDITCINLYYLTCSKCKILNIVKGGA